MVPNKDESGREQSGKHIKHFRYCFSNLGTEAGTEKPVRKTKSVMRDIENDPIRSEILR